MHISVPMRRTASTVATVGSVSADATRPRRALLHALTLGSEAAPADNAFLWRLRRFTAPGTSTAVTPLQNNPADSATEMDAGENHTVEPTYAGGNVLLVPLNQKSTFRWAALLAGKEKIFPATASNGLGLDTPTATAVVVTAEAELEEQ
jgi:hypothetical protein